MLKNTLIPVKQPHTEMYKAIDDLQTWVDTPIIVHALTNLLTILNFMSIGVAMQISYHYTGKVPFPGIQPKMPNCPDDMNTKVYDLVELHEMAIKIVNEIEIPNLYCITGKSLTTGIAKLLSINPRQEF